MAFLQAQDDPKQLLQDAVNTWDVLSTNIQIHNLKNHTSPDSVKTMGGSGTFFGHTIGLEVSFKNDQKKEIRRVMIDFPESAVLSSEHFRAIFEKSKDEFFPRGFGTKIGVKHFEIEIENKKVTDANIVLNFGTWAPDGNNSNDALKLSQIEAEFGVMDLNTSEPNIVIGLTSYLFMPRQVANYINLDIGDTGLLVKGYVNTKTYKIALGFDLSSDEIPLDDPKTIILKNANAEFYFDQGKAGIAIGGQIQIRPQGNPPTTFKGEISIDIAERKLFAQAYMPPGEEWVNPFGLNDKITITQAGIGFGLSFSGSIPTPSFAVTGGIKVKDNFNKLRFAGGLTLAIDAGNPSQNMIDAQVGPLNMKDLIDAFHQHGTPGEFETELSKLTFDKLHFRLVPPGPGVNVFEVFYEPGFYAEGRFNYNNSIKGALLVDIDEEGVEAFGGISPIEFQGLKFTGTSPDTPPHFYLSVKPEEKILAMAINGKLEVLGSSSLADIYFSEAGFSATMKTTIMGGFTSQLDLAGTNLIEGGSIYVKASMSDKDNLVQKITTMASEEIERRANAKEKEFEELDAELKKYEPLYKQKEKELEALKEKVRKDYRKKCAAIKSDENEKREKETLKKKKQNIIVTKKAEIKKLEKKLSDEEFVRAKNLNPTSCGNGSEKIENYCYTCPQGYEWNGPVRTTNSKACIKRGEHKYANAVYKKNAPCNRGQITNTVVGIPPRIECWECPSGYKPSEGVVDVKASNRCYKVIKDEFKAPIKGSYVGCPGSMNPTSRKRDDLGKCWECPSGYERTAFRIDGSKACTFNNMTERRSSIAAKKAEVIALETEIGDLSDVINQLNESIKNISADICNKVNDTDAVMLDPQIANSQVLKDYNKYRDIVILARDAIALTKTVSVGAIKAEAWLVKNAGTALSIVDIDSASFEGCLSTVDGGHVKLKVAGTFADAPINTFIELYLPDPDQAIKAFANILYASNDLSTVSLQSNCNRPDVPQPESEGKIAELLKYVNGDIDTKLAKEVKIIEFPKWAETPKFTEDRTDPQSFNVRTNNVIKTSSTTNNSSSRTSHLNQEITWNNPSNSNPDRNTNSSSNTRSNTTSTSSSSSTNNSSTTSNDLPPNPEVARQWYEEGEVMFKQKNYSEALRLFKKSIKLKHVESNIKLGIMYERGLGVSQNPQIAIKYYRYAENHGSLEAVFHIGRCHEFGIGTTVDKNLAFEKYLKAANQNFEAAYYYLGRCYSFGLGSSFNIKESMLWFKKAADAGDRRGEKILQLFKDKGFSNNSDPLDWVVALLSDSRGYFRLETKQSKNQSLEANELTARSPYKGAAYMAKSKSHKGQYWRLIPMGKGRFQLTNALLIQKDQALEGNSVGPRATLGGAAFMTTRGAFTGQAWKLVPTDKGYFRLQTVLSEGKGECLDAKNNAPEKVQSGAVHMAPISNADSQLWRVIPF